MGTRGVIVWSTLTLSLVAVFIVPAIGLQCYQCNSTNNTHLFQCNEFLTDDIDMIPESCDNVYGAKYCIKHVGRFEVLGLECYQCTTAEEWTCHESTLLTDALNPESCDHVHNAQYCIKTIGLYGGC
ncbi:hypothetical protein PV328_003339 [Microctonus aethiopoides]|uniref:Uncharacterized protein n=1 Tax=Microctonus aethiopoides TaxID=144406 RepID=A0AA39F8G1_9HYME|nr:hypothetical protein PV328_003339 [Microctonus aethiopoides]